MRLESWREFIEPVAKEGRTWSHLDPNHAPRGQGRSPLQHLFVGATLVVALARTR